MQPLNLLKPFGVDIFCTGKKFLVFNLVGKNLKTKYYRSFLGLFWTLLSPLAVTIVYYFVFKVVLNVQIPHYLAFILSGTLPWSFFNQTIFEGMESLAGHLGLLTKVPIPFQVFPFVGALTNLTTLAFATPILIITALLNGVTLGWSIVLLPVYLLALFLMTYSFSLSLSILFVLLRDLRHLMGIVMQIWFYASPVLYDEAMIPAKYHWIIYLNPVAFIFIDLHCILVRGEFPPAEHALYILGWILIGLSTAVLIHKSLSNDLVERM